jgi:hypothetical protein
MTASNNTIGLGVPISPINETNLIEFYNATIYKYKPMCLLF